MMLNVSQSGEFVGQHYPAYGKINEIRVFVSPGVPLIACTITATKCVQQEVLASLEMNACEVVSTSPDRPNIFMRCIVKQSLRMTCSLSRTT